MKRVTTAIIPDDSIRHNYLQNREYDSNGTGTLKKAIVTIIIRGVTETLSLVPKTRVYIGRFHPDNEVEVDLDLSPYGGAEYGVSRLHACVELNNKNQLFITDLRSTNGTVLAGKKLRSYEPTLVRNGDEIIVGTLLLKAKFDFQIG